MKKMISILAAFTLVLSACSNSVVDDAVREIQNVTDADNRYVVMVKNGYRESRPDLTYGKAFDSFFGSPRWIYFKGEDGEDVVEFTGDCLYQEVSVTARIQFVIDELNGTFEAIYLAFNEVPQNALMLSTLIEKVFEEAEGNGASDGKTTMDPVEEARQAIEDWIAGHLGDEGAVLTLTDQYASFWGDDAYEFLMTWSNGEAWNPIFFVKDTGLMYIDDDTGTYLLDDWYDLWFGDADYDYFYAERDASLYGRWRSADGSVIELSEQGYAETSLDLRPWWAIGRSTSLTWEASNGQLLFTTGYYAEYKYLFFPDTEDDNFSSDRLVIGDSTFYRMPDTVGNGIIGEWDDNYMGGAYFIFNDDGTGAFAHDKLIWWWTDDEYLYISYNLYTTYDYYVTGDSLQIFFSDGSQYYTRVSK